MNSDYQKISSFIEIIKNQSNHLNFEKAFEKADISRNDFEKLVKNWSGLSLSQFFNAINPKHNFSLLNHDSQTSLFDEATENYGKAASEFTQIIPMTDEEYGDKGSNLKINYEFYDSPFGEMIVATTSKGVCYTAFDENREEAFRNLKSRFYNSEFSQKKTEFQTAAMSIFDLKNSKTIKLYMKGTEFQLTVWNQLLKIPIGKLVSYHMIADDLKMPTASRAIGTAIGRNPIAYIVPCHRVIQSGGNFGGYMWGNTRKMAITAWEAGFKFKT